MNCAFCGRVAKHSVLVDMVHICHRADCKWDFWRSHYATALLTYLSVKYRR